MNSAFSEEILVEKLSKLNNSQHCIETLSHWCIFHQDKAQLLVSTWEKQFSNTGMVQKIPLLFLANDILQNSKRKGDEFITEFWNVLPSAMKEVVKNGDDNAKKAAFRLVWEDRRVFGSRAQNLKAVMLGEDVPPPLDLSRKRDRSVKIVKKDSRSIRTKLAVGGTVEKIVSAFHQVLNEHTDEDEEMNKCKSTVERVRKMGKEVDVALTKAKDLRRKTLSKELEEEELLLKQCIKKFKAVEANRLALLSQLRDALQEQEAELQNLQTQMQVAQKQVEEAANLRNRLDDENYVAVSELSRPVDAARKPTQTTNKSTAAIAAEVAEKLAASSSSQYIITSVLSKFAAEEAKNAGLMKSSNAPTSSASVFDTNPMMKHDNVLPAPEQSVFPPQLNPPQNTYQSLMVPQPMMQSRIPNSPAQYHSLPNPHSQQYLQPSGGNLVAYDYGNLPPLPSGPPPSAPAPPPPPPPYMASSMVSMPQQPFQMRQQQQLPVAHQASTLPQQQQPAGPQNFRQQASGQASGMVYYPHHYQSQ